MFNACVPYVPAESWQQNLFTINPPGGTAWFSTCWICMQDYVTECVDSQMKKNISDMFFRNSRGVGRVDGVRVTRRLCS